MLLINCTQENVCLYKILYSVFYLIQLCGKKSFTFISLDGRRTVLLITIAYLRETHNDRK